MSKHDSGILIHATRHDQYFYFLDDEISLFINHNYIFRGGNEILPGDIVLEFN